MANGMMHDRLSHQLPLELDCASQCFNKRFRAILGVILPMFAAKLKACTTAESNGGSISIMMKYGDRGEL
jgi:hypothetical protein